jgi:hypothetical protein
LRSDFVGSLNIRKPLFPVRQKDNLTRSVAEFG